MWTFFQYLIKYFAVVPEANDFHNRSEAYLFCQELKLNLLTIKDERQQKLVTQKLTSFYNKSPGISVTKWNPCKFENPSRVKF